MSSASILRRWRRPGAAAGVLLAAAVSTSCVSYRAAPLPGAAELASPAPPDLERLRVEAAELQHPRLEPVTVDFSDGLSPDEAGVLAVLVNRDLIAARAAHEEAVAQLVAAGLLPAPIVSLSGDQPYGTGSKGTVLATSQGLEIDVAALVQRSATVAEAAATVDSVDLGIAWQEWQVAQSARLQALRVGWLDRRIAAADTELGAESRTLQTLKSAMEQGDATLPDVGTQLATVESLRQSRDELRRARIDALGELDRVLGLEGTKGLRVSLPDRADVQAVALDAGALVEAAMEQRLDLLGLRRGYDAQEARVRVAVLAQLPSLSVGVVHQRNESALRFLGGYVTLALPALGRSRAKIQEESATRARLGKELEARAATVRTEIRTLVASLSETAAQIRRAQAAIDRLEPVAEAERVAALRGDVDRLSEQVVRTALFDSRADLAALSQAREETLAGLETTVGCPMGALTGGVAP